MRNSKVCHVLLAVLCMMLLGSVPVKAALPSSILYIKDHLYYHLGDEMNVIDVNLEWPEQVDGSLVVALKQYLAQYVFGISNSNFDEVYQLFKKRFGTPVRGQLATLPDDQKYCYVDCRVKQMGHVSNRFISFSLDYNCQPAKLSSQPADTKHILITYDLVRQRVLTMDELLRLDRMQGPEFVNRYGLYFNSSVDTDYLNQLKSLKLNNACLVDNRLLLEMTLGTFNGENTDFEMYIGKDVERLLNKEMVKSLKQIEPATILESLQVPTELDGEPIYANVEKSPSFPGGIDSLRQFVLSNITYPIDQQLIHSSGQVKVSFVLDKKGQIRNVSVIGMLSPVLDREAVRVIKLMPNWVPGEINGVPVNTQVIIPVTFFSR